MILCGWIVLILQIQSVFNCSSEPSDPCCPDEDFCCNDGIEGLCCKNDENWFKIHFEADGFYSSAIQCYCQTPYGTGPQPPTKDSMCHF